MTTGIGRAARSGRAQLREPFVLPWPHEAEQRRRTVVGGRVDGKAIAAPAIDDAQRRVEWRRTVAEAIHESHTRRGITPPAPILFVPVAIDAQVEPAAATDFAQRQRQLASRASHSRPPRSATDRVTSFVCTGRSSASAKNAARSPMVDTTSGHAAVASPSPPTDGK
jgi:hypothetical protein